MIDDANDRWCWCYGDRAKLVEPVKIYALTSPSKISKVRRMLLVTFFGQVQGFGGVRHSVNTLNLSVVHRQIVAAAPMIAFYFPG